MDFHYATAAGAGAGTIGAALYLYIYIEFANTRIQNYAIIHAKGMGYSTFYRV